MSGAKKDTTAKGRGIFTVKRCMLLGPLPAYRNRYPLNVVRIHVRLMAAVVVVGKPVGVIVY